jgi:hypothetical protein
MGNCSSSNKEIIEESPATDMENLKNLLNLLKMQERNGTLYDKIGKLYFKDVRLFL